MVPPTLLASQLRRLIPRILRHYWGLGYGAHGYFPPEVYMLGATYIYAGDVETGKEIVRTCLEGISGRRLYLDTTQRSKRRHRKGHLRFQLLSEHDAMGSSRGTARPGHTETAAGGRLVNKVLDAGKQA